MMISSKLQRGFSLLTAIFLLVVLAGLGGVMVTFSGVQQQSSSLDVLGSRAYQASRAGIEWAAYHIAQQPRGMLWTGCETVPVPLFAANTLAGNLSPFSVILTCSSVAAMEGGVPIFIYDLGSTASNGGTAGSKDKVERAFNAKMGR